ncbi:conserved hypothetical protein (plasmid) [Rhodococcus jostii RHA1]|uniref:Uncharacterized protein n=1 Tax=Rhodococcus jostii (strain RHA1) TaxID=101510 RepID=Q0RXE9_RHOJR|nr:conserved hypothetical protein [Rhodococcus jostii RHA1]
MARGILVNGRGQRYIAEDTYASRIAQETLLRQNGDVFLVLDESSYEEALQSESTTAVMRGMPTWVCETVEELESEMGLPIGGLRSTVELFNQHAATSSDPFFFEKAEWVRSPPTTCGEMMGDSHSAA